MSRTLPAPTGEFAVGRTHFDLVDASRTETLSGSGTSGPRELVLWIWYPAEPAPNSPAAPYLPAGWEASDSVMGSPLGTATLASHSYEDAPPALGHGAFPVLLFSAAGLSPLSYAAIIEEVCSHGYVVVSICHAYEAPVTVFRDGRVISASPEYLMQIAMGVGDMQGSFDFRAGVARQKCDDIAFVAGALGDVDSPITALFDLRRIGAFGHSLGGNAALEWCRTDDRCCAAVNLDGALWTEVGKVGLTKPAMVIAAEHPEMIAPPEQLVAVGAFPSVEWALGERAILFDGWQKVVETGKPGAVHTIEGARHANFGDVTFVSIPEGSPLRNVIGPVKPEVMWGKTTQLLLDFFGAHLGTQAASDDVLVARE